MTLSAPKEHSPFGYSAPSHTYRVPRFDEAIDLRDRHEVPHRGSCRGNEGDLGRYKRSNDIWKHHQSVRLSRLFCTMYPHQALFVYHYVERVALSRSTLWPLAPLTKSNVRCLRS